MTIDDVLGEAFETYLTIEDANIIRTAFKDNPRLMRAIQKIFIPTIQDPEMKPESMADDFWLSGTEWEAIPADETKAMVVGRERAIKHVMGGLIRIKSIANVKEETLQETANRRSKDSTK